MKFLFDNNLSPHLAHAIAALSKSEPSVEEVIHLRDRFEGNTPDTDWLNELANEGGWIVISKDQFKKSSAERQLVRESGLTVFVLDPQWSNHIFWNQAHQLVLWWPKIIQYAKLTSKAAVRVPWRFTNKSTFEQIG